MALPEGEVIDIVAFGLLFIATAAQRIPEAADLQRRSTMQVQPFRAGLSALDGAYISENIAKRQREHSARRIEMVWIIGGGIIYLILVVTLGVMSIRKGHWVMFIIGFFLPFFWLIGALMPSRRLAY